jgi:hypothetical protein
MSEIVAHVADLPGAETRDFHMSILGRLLEHLGVQMYKRRTVAVAELVANCWDAGADNVWITVPEPDAYDRITSVIEVRDDGIGMSPDEVDGFYLVVGRNRRKQGQPAAKGRAEMGRKGIGKLAGFGVATRMSVMTWKDGTATEIDMNLGALKREPGVSQDVIIPGTVAPVSQGLGPSGTRVRLTDLKHKTPLNLQDLREALGRRFSRRARGQMKIHLNGVFVADPRLDLEIRVPADADYATSVLPDGNEVRYYYGFTRKPIQSRELRGWTIYVREKTAEAPPFYFNVEGTASGQHSTKYLTGEIYADFIDAGTDDESDLVSTDRQEIDWEDERVRYLRQWGEAVTRKALRERSETKGSELERTVLEQDKFRARIDRLDPASQRQVSRFLKLLGESEPDDERVEVLADSLIKSFEYRHFHDVIHEIESVEDNPEELQRLLSHLADWKVLESRTILEIIHGRLGIIEKFHQMIVNDAPETTKTVGQDNMHDLIAEYPWLINPEWQVLAEERSISRQLREWNAEYVTDAAAQMRYDFLALTDASRLVIIEIKRAGHPVTLEETQRLEVYQDRLLQAHSNVHMVLVSGTKPALSSQTRKAWEERPDGELLQWQEVHRRTRSYYEHYKAVLEGDVANPDFLRKTNEVLKSREILRGAPAYRSREERREGVGAQDVYHVPDEGGFIPDLVGDDDA